MIIFAPNQTFAYFNTVSPMKIVSDVKNTNRTACTIHCQNCSISQLCLPFTLNEHELTQLDNIIERKNLFKIADYFQSGDELRSIYAIRSGTIKSYTISESGEEQITAFHLPGDLVGFDAITNMKHVGFAQALETSMICEIPFDILDDLAGKCLKSVIKLCV
ncbi:fumarate/nitrate reduction transcriptional regulator [Actinobacillus equuli]|nr:fumarate/nitrate reduction transcriptional regulator [Actinobacillus equuli]